MKFNEFITLLESEEEIVEKAEVQLDESDKEDLVAEDDQLDELKQETYTAARKAIVKKMNGLNDDTPDSYHPWPSNMKKEPKTDENKERQLNKLAGSFARAAAGEMGRLPVKRLKEDLDEMADEELEAFLVSEEFKQLDELDQKTLKSYLEKRGGEVIPKIFTNKAKDDPKFEKKVVGVSRSLDKIKEDDEKEVKEELEPDLSMDPYTRYLDTNPFTQSNPFYISEGQTNINSQDINESS